MCGFAYYAETSPEPRAFQMAEKSKSVSPPYATYGAFINFINKLRDSSIPSRIDPSVFGNASGSVSYSIIAALKYLKLIDEDGKPSQKFAALVRASDEQRGPILQEIVRGGYPSLFSGEIDLRSATAGQFDEHVRKEFDVTGSTVDKIAAFFISAAKQAGIELSPHLLARKPVAGSSSSRKSTRQRKRDSNEGNGESSRRETDGDTVFQPITEKALEYRLVDLMSEAADQPDVMDAIIRVIKFLKTRQITDRETATD